MEQNGPISNNGRILKQGSQQDQRENQEHSNALRKILENFRINNYGYRTQNHRM